MAIRKAQKRVESLAASNTFSGVALLWLAHWRSDKSPRHADTVRRRMEANIFPTIGSRPKAAIEAPELVDTVRSIKGCGVTDLAKPALETTGQIFRYAIAQGLTSRNPAAEIKPRDVLRPTRKKNFARIDAKELPALLRKIEIYPGTHLTRLALKLMALTFVRTTELIGAAWSEFDVGAARWDIPAGRMKTRRPHVIPLAPQALEVVSHCAASPELEHWYFQANAPAPNPCLTTQSWAPSNEWGTRA